MVWELEEVNYVCHCDEERVSNLTDSFLLEMLGLLPFGRNDRLSFLLWVVRDIGIASYRRLDALNSERTG